MKNEGKQDQRPGFLTQVLSILGSYLVALFPLAYYTNKNFSYVSVKEIWLSLALVSAHWLLVLLISLISLKGWSKASFATMILVLPLSLFHTFINVITRYVPRFYYWHGIILMILGIGLLWYVIHYHVKEDVARKLSIIFGSVILVLLLVNISPSVVRKVKENRAIKQSMELASAQENKVVEKQENLPNIYLFIFDEYAGHEGLERYAGFDNQAFYDDLNRLGFNVSKGSRSYTIWTRVEIPNLMNLDTVAKENSDQSKDRLMQNPVLFNTLRSLGYDINLINDQNFISTPNAYFKYSHTLSSDFKRAESLMSLLIDRSAYYPVLEKVVGNRLGEVYGMFQYGADSSKLQKAGLFTFAYLSFPHLPWFVDEKGNQAAVKNQLDGDATDLYLGQLKYANKLIHKLVKEIIENDPESCIILLSDHGYRKRDKEGASLEEIAVEDYYRRNILQAVYILGEKVDFDGYSGINTLRKVLDTLFSLDLGLIEEAQ